MNDRNYEYRCLIKQKLFCIIMVLAIVSFIGTAAYAGTLSLTKGSWDTIGLDSNNVNVGPNQFLIQIHVTNTGVAATNVSGSISLGAGSAYINLAPGEPGTKSLGDFAPGETKDLFFLIQVTRNALAYNTSRPYTITVSGTGTGAPDTITGTLFAEKLVSQNRNDVISIVSSNTTPTLGDTFSITVVSSTASAGYNIVNLPIAQYNPAVIEPVDYTVTYGASTSGDIRINNPGTTSFTSVWIFRAVGEGNTVPLAFITDQSGSSFHYNSDYGDNISIQVTPRADLSIIKTVDNTTPINGQNVTFTLTVTNNGPNDATGVIVNDLLPAGLSYVSSTPSQGTYNSGTGIWNIGNLANGSTANLTITATVTSAGQIINSASVSGNEEDPDTTNNQDLVSLNGVPTADLAISKTADSPLLNVGQTVTFTVTVTNAGPDNATNVTVTDTWPSGLTILSATPSQGTFIQINPTTYQWAIGSLADNATATLTIVAEAAETGQLTNTVTVTGDQYDPHTPDNSSSADVDVNPTADLAVVKTVDDDTPIVLQNITFTITVTNNGPNNATGVVMDDLLPAGLLFISSVPSQGSYNSLTGLWTIGNLANSETATLTITAQVTTASAQIDNIAGVSGNEYDPNILNNEDTISLNGVPSADLAIIKTADNTLPNVGQNVTFTLTITNNGPNDATNVIVNDLLPAGLTYVSDNPSQGSYNSGTGVWTVGNLAHTASASIVITATATQTGFITNISTVTGNEFDPDTGDNTSAVTLDVQPTADLSVTKSANTTTPPNGTNVTFTITVTNNGPNIATGVTVNDLLPAGLTLTVPAPSATQGTYNPVTGVWTIGTLSNGSSATLTITATVTVSGQINNFVNVSGNEYDPNLANNEDLVSLNGLPTSDLFILKTVNIPAPNVGQNVTFTITVTNNGPDNATTVVVNDLLPSSLSFVSATPSQGTYSQGPGIWNVGNIAHTSSATLTLVATVLQPGLTTNTATVSGDQLDPDTDDNTSSASVNAPSADLSIVKTVDNLSPNVTENVTFTVSVTNNGPNTATNVTVNDALPAGLTWVSDNSAGAYNPVTGVWTIGTLGNGASVSITITAQVTAAVQINNIATVTGGEYDPDLGNNQDIESLNGSPTADLFIQKTVDDPTPNVGQNVTFTITVTNAGPNDATNVTVNDLLPIGLSFVSATPSQGTYNFATGIWTVGSLVHTASATLLITAQVTQTGILLNTATVTGDQYDPHPGDNTSSSSVNGQPAADLSILKTAVCAGFCPVGAAVTVTIIVTNNGPNNATGVIMTDLLPAGLTYVLDNGLGAYVPATGVWSIGNLNNGASVSLIINATVAASGQINNIARVTGDQYDPNPNNNEDIAVLNGALTADLAIFKTVNFPAPNVGQNVTFTITVTNNGPDNASSVIVNDLLPAGLLYVSSATLTGTYAPATGVWTIGALAHNASTTLTIVATVQNVGITTNTATVSNSGQIDPDPDDNTSSTDVNGQPVANVQVTKTAFPASQHVGQNVTFRIFVVNNGPSNATGVIINDPLPAGVTFISANPSQGSYNQSTGDWDVGNLSNGSTAILDIVVRIDIVGDIRNVATKTGQNEFDPDTSNDSGDATIEGTSLPIPIPTMTEWGMIIYVILGGLGAAYYLSRKTAKIY